MSFLQRVNCNRQDRQEHNLGLKLKSRLGDLDRSSFLTSNSITYRFIVISEATGKLELLYQRWEHRFNLINVAFTSAHHMHHPAFPKD